MHDHVYQGLANPSRRRILSLLGAGELSAGGIAKAFEFSRPAVSQHLAVLLKAKLLDCRREGRRRLYSVSPRAMNDLRKSMEEFWADSMLRLKMAAETEAGQIEDLKLDRVKVSSSRSRALSGSGRSRGGGMAATGRQKKE